MAPEKPTTKQNKEKVPAKTHKRRASKVTNQPLSEQDTNTNKKSNNANSNTKPNNTITNRPATPEGQTLKAKTSDSSGAKRLAEFKRRLQERHIKGAKNKEN